MGQRNKDCTLGYLCVEKVVVDQAPAASNTPQSLASF